MKRVLPVLLLAVACAHVAETPPSGPAAPPGPAPAANPVAAAPLPEPEELRRIRADVEALLAAQGEATWVTWTTGAPLDVAGPMRGREWLADGGALRALDALPAAPTPAEAARRRLLRDLLVGERLAAVTKTEPAPEFTFPHDGRTIALRDAPSVLAAESDPARRAALDAARAPAAARAARAADAEARALAAAARKAGLGELNLVVAELRRATMAELAALAGATLDATGPAYCTAMEALARAEVGSPLASTHLRDLPRILRASHEPRAHAAARLVEDGRAAAAAAGVDLAARVRVDDAPTPGKSRRPLAVPVRVPDDVRLSVLPSGGASEARAFLHELGVAVSRSAVRSPEVEARRLGSPVVTETWGALLEALASDPAWINERAGLVGHSLAREMKASQAERLHAVRVRAGRVLREIERAQGGPPGAAADAKVLSRVLCRTVSVEDATRWPIARDPLLASADTLRGILLAAQLEAAWTAEGGGPWWRWKGAPARLGSLWATGGLQGPDELLRSAGLGALSPEPLARTARMRFDAAGW